MRKRKKFAAHVPGMAIPVRTPFFGDTKQNQQFRRFHLQGIEKVTVEMTVAVINRKVEIIEFYRKNLTYK
jgi:hypothetical protein